MWDVEQNLEVFISADRIAQHWFLVALHAICVLQEHGREISSAEACDLAETLWAHCHFVGQFFEIDTENSIAAEFAARTAVQYGDPSDVWLLNQARDKKVGPRALWALVDPTNSKERTRKRAKCSVRQDDNYRTYPCCLRSFW